jgi:type IX secretion system PorP/SprF family membrane protein
MNKNKVDDPSDARVAATDNVWRPGVDVGVYFDMPRFYAGLSVMSVIPNRADEPSMMIMRSDPSCFLTVGGLIPLARGLALLPSTLLKTDFQSPITWDINAMLMIVERFRVGASYRTGVTFVMGNRDFDKTEQYDAVVILAEAFVTDRIRLGVAYDFDLNHLASTHNGSFEVSLGYSLCSPKRKSGRYF